MMQAYKSKWLPPNALALGMALSFGASTDERKSMAVTAIVEHPASDVARDGVKEALQEAGCKDDKNLKRQYQSTQDNTGTAAQIVRKPIGSKPDVIVGIVTPSAQALMAAIKNIPTVFSTVTDPVGAHLTSSWEASGTNVTGVSDMLALGKQIGLIKKAVPGAGHAGTVYNPGGASSVVVVKELKELLPEIGLSPVEASALHSVDISSVARSLASEVDVIYTNIGNNVVSAYEVLVKVGNDVKISLITSDTDNVKRGVITALDVNYREIGKQTGRVMMCTLRGKKPDEIKPETSDSLQLFVNPGAAQKRGVALFGELFRSAAEIIK